MPKVKFLPSNIEVEAKAGETLLDLALKSGISIQHACGGFCACTTCHSIIEEGFERTSEIQEEEQERMEYLDERQSHSRLACQTKIQGDLVVRVVNEE